MLNELMGTGLQRDEQLKAPLVALVGDCGSVPSTHLMVHDHSLPLVPKIQTPSSDICRHQACAWHTTHTRRQNTYKRDKYNFKFKQKKKMQIGVRFYLRNGNIWLLKPTAGSITTRCGMKNLLHIWHTWTTGFTQTLKSGNNNQSEDKNYVGSIVRGFEDYLTPCVQVDVLIYIVPQIIYLTQAALKKITTTLQVFLKIKT